MSWELFWLLVEASGLTIVYSAVSIFFGFLLAAAICGADLSGRAAVARPARLFVSFFRGTPLLIQLLLIYYLLPKIGLNVPSEVAAVIGLSFSTASYQAEILRGGFQSVPRGVVEAADMCGLSARATFRRIRLPIAVRLTLPALTSEAIMILKSSSLISVVGVVELTTMAKDLASSTYQPLPIFASAGFIYLVINLVVAGLGLWAERSARRGHA
ncbi:amino acid ABC transporter permease [Siculibacillus lacustris]|uniref:Amino acid ABC transporter permease n=1 Tax=Siculibacillus lacustris TaxID=1549641 RepID=A0A4Q9VYE9_9HYPH|nr:amino acid ABC transporter permease [Siculibacillus lacustris]TBW41045.1 amino acid ABC transporter permease [Siculibacillus lacustris]